MQTTWENINQDKLPISVRLEEPKNNLYLVDDAGHEYAYLENEGITEQETIIRPGVKKSASFIFSQIQLGANTASLYIDFWAMRENKNFYTERFIVESLNFK